MNENATVRHRDRERTDTESEATTTTTTTTTDDRRNGKQANTSSEFVRFTRREFEDFLADSVPGEFTPVAHDADEYVYSCEVPGNSIELRVFSSVSRRTDCVRGKGEDAIRTVLWDRRVGHPVGGRERTHRIGTWRDNLADKIEHLRAISPAYSAGDCPECSSSLLVRDGEHGEFIGCERFPNCYHTESFDAEGASA